MEVPPLSQVVSGYFSYRKKQRRVAKVYYKRLLKAALFLSIVPMMLVAILVVYHRLTVGEGIFASILALYGSMFFAKPYLADLSSLTHYVKQLARDRDAKMPPLSFISNVEELSQSVAKLHYSWGKRRSQLESALAESRLLFDTIPDMLLIVDSSLEVTRANHSAFFKLRNNIIRQRLENVIKDAEFIEKVQQCIEGHRSATCELTFERHNVVFDYEVRIECLPSDSPRNIAALIILHDISEAKKSRQAIKAFVANASHEIRTPLTSIVGFIEMIQEMGEDEIETRDHFLELVADQSDRLVNLVNDLLSLSKAEMNESKPPVDPVKLQEIVGNVLRRTQLTVSQAGKSFDNKLKDSLPEVIGDTNELTQVFTNLITNAIKYSEENAVVTLSSRLRKTKKSTEHHAPKELCIDITDQGEGIPSEYLERITERFYRIESKSNAKIAGTGLGLSIVKHILHRHRGYLEVKSTVGVGSVFTAVLPVDKA